MTTTSYAILGLLAVKPWTTHELVRQVDRSLRRVWPRAQSKLYEEPKKLVQLGYARSTEEFVGRRRRTRYTITARGRRALAEWLGEPGSGPVLEFEQLLKISFADSGTKQGILTNLAATLDWIQSQNVENLEAARAYGTGEGPFQQRAAVNQLGGTFLTDYYLMVARWAEWATDVVRDWPENPAQATINQTEQDAAVRRAEMIDSIARRVRARLESGEPAP